MNRKGWAFVLAGVAMLWVLAFFSLRPAPAGDTSSDRPVLTDKRQELYRYKVVVTDEFFNGQTKKFEETTLEYYCDDIEWDVTTSYSTIPDPAERGRAVLPRRTVSESYSMPGSVLSVAYGKREHHARGIGFSFSGAKVIITDQTTGKVIWQDGKLER